MRESIKVDEQKLNSLFSFLTRKSAKFSLNYLTFLDLNYAHFAG